MREKYPKSYLKGCDENTKLLERASIRLKKFLLKKDKK